MLKSIFFDCYLLKSLVRQFLSLLNLNNNLCPDETGALFCFQAERSLIKVDGPCSGKTPCIASPVTFSRYKDVLSLAALSCLFLFSSHIDHSSRSFSGLHLLFADHCWSLSAVLRLHMRHQHLSFHVIAGLSSLDLLTGHLMFFQLLILIKAFEQLESCSLNHCSVSLLSLLLAQPHRRWFVFKVSWRPLCARPSLSRPLNLHLFAFLCQSLFHYRSADLELCCGIDWGLSADADHRGEANTESEHSCNTTNEEIASPPIANPCSLNKSVWSAASIRIVSERDLVAWLCGAEREAESQWWIEARLWSSWKVDPASIYKLRQQGYCDRDGLETRLQKVDLAFAQVTWGAQCRWSVAKVSLKRSRQQELMKQHLWTFLKECSAQPAPATWVEYKVVMVESCARECCRDWDRGAAIKCVRHGDRAVMPAIDNEWRWWRALQQRLCKDQRCIYPPSCPLLFTGFSTAKPRPSSFSICIFFWLLCARMIRWPRSTWTAWNSTTLSAWLGWLTRILWWPCSTKAKLLRTPKMGLQVCEVQHEKRWSNKSRSPSECKKRSQRKRPQSQLKSGWDYPPLPPGPDSFPCPTTGFEAVPTPRSCGTFGGRRGSFTIHVEYSALNKRGRLRS